MGSNEKLCLGCMKQKEGDGVCPHCGFDPSLPQNPLFLPLKSTLQNRYVVGRCIDHNGEGIGYIGYDAVSRCSVYIREFLPDNLASRQPGGANVLILTGCDACFSTYKREFLFTMRAAARMRELPAVLPVFDIFEENNTAYTISEWVECITLEQMVQRSGGALQWEKARPLFMPVLSSLSTMNQSGVQHLGLSPQNLVVTQNGKMLMRGFAIHAVRQMDTDLKPQLYPGCSALEQYVKEHRTGECTDVYGFTACLFYALTGTLPKDALRRKSDARLLIPTSILNSIPKHVVAALANGLQVPPEKRTPTFERLRAELSAAPTVTMIAREAAAPPKPVPGKAQKKPENGKTGGMSNMAWGVVSCVIALAVLSVVALIVLSLNKGEEGEAGSGITSSVSSDVSSLQSSQQSSSSSEAPANQIDAPNLVGKSYEDMKKQGEASGDYQVRKSTEEFDDTFAEGDIISQTPENGAKMAKGSIIAVVVSKGPSVRELPAIKNLSLSDASVAVTEAGFIPRKSEEAFSDEVPAGSVIGYKRYEEGDMMEYGTIIEIVVSKGPDPTAARNEE